MAEHEKQRLLLHGGNGLQDKIKVCIRGVDLVRFPKSSRNCDRVKVLFVGRQSREKGYGLFQKLAQKVAEILGCPSPIMWLETSTRASRAGSSIWDL